MDVAIRLARFKDQPPEQWLKSANRVLPPAVSLLLVLIIAYQLATLTWRILPGVALDAPAPEVATTNQATAEGPGLGYERLTESHLFGTAPAADAERVAVQEVFDAPDTTLNLVLTGTVTRSETEVGQAIITSGRDESHTYTVGDTIENASGALLHAVYKDRVLLNRSGRLETLRLVEESATVRRVAAPNARPAPRVASQSGGTLREVISDNASRITDVIRLAPHLEQGQMIGFRLNPGRDRDAFTALGLEAGDVVTDINGTVLNDPSAGLQVFEALGEATMANVTIVRGGVPQVIVIDTSQLQELTENSQ